MKRNLLAVMYLLLAFTARSQNFTAEALIGDRYLFYQHFFANKFSPSSRLGVMHIANVISRYEHDAKEGGMPDELMNQAYLSLQTGRKFTLLAGMFYNNVNGIRASAGVQFAHSFKNGLLVFVPRIDVQLNTGAELMGMLEYSPVISETLRLYSRIQVMSNIGPYHHNRSYQRLRLGVDFKAFQAGLAVNFDEYGADADIKVNKGLFIRKTF